MDNFFSIAAMFEFAFFPSAMEISSNNFAGVDKEAAFKKVDLKFGISFSSVRRQCWTIVVYREWKR